MAQVWKRISGSGPPKAALTSGPRSSDHQGGCPVTFRPFVCTSTLQVQLLQLQSYCAHRLQTCRLCLSSHLTNLEDSSATSSSYLDHSSTNSRAIVNFGVLYSGLLHRSIAFAAGFEAFVHQLSHQSHSCGKGGSEIK